MVATILILLNQTCVSFIGESVSDLKHTDVVIDERAVNQDKTNLLFSVRLISFLNNFNEALCDRAVILLL